MKPSTRSNAEHYHAKPAMAPKPAPVAAVVAVKPVAAIVAPKAIKAPTPVQPPAPTGMGNALASAMSSKRPF